MRDTDGHRWAFVDWAADCSRSSNMASRLDMTLIRRFKPRKSAASLPYKYAFQFVSTLGDLARLRPERVVCMSPSPLTALPVWLYCRASGAEFAIDAHTGAFLGKPWEQLPWIQRFFTKRALAIMVTNDHLRSVVEESGGRAIIVPDVPTEQEAPTRVELPPGFNIVFVASYGYDEPLAEVIEAARGLEGVTVHITGKPKAHVQHLIDGRPDNVKMTGFLSREDYLATIAQADAVLALTTRNHTMQRAAYEAIYLGTPVVVSDWPVLRDNFSGGAVFTDNDPASLRAAIEAARDGAEELRQGAEELRQRKLERWAESKARIEYVLGSGS